MQEEQTNIFYSQQDRQIINMNSHVVKLIKEKTIPLNKNRYEHLQKINRALRKKETSTISQVNYKLPLDLVKNKDNSTIRPKMLTSRKNYLDAEDILMNQLKTLKILKNGKLISINDKSEKYWESLQNSKIKSLQTERDEQFNHQMCEQWVSYRLHRKENLLEVVQKAEKFLRFKKHELKQKHNQQQQIKQSNKDHRKRLTQLEKYLKTFGNERHTSKEKVITNSQLQSELLRDIRQNMMESKMNRLKRDINHKKIVQLR